MAVDTSPNPRSARKSGAAKATSGKPTGEKSVAVQSAQPERKAQRSDGARRAPALMDAERRRALIAETAYFRSERRGFEPGHEAEDWLAAELEIDRALAIGVSPSFKPAVQ